MEDIVNALAGVFYLATTEDDQPHVRPFDGATLHDGKLYIGTNRNKAVYNQIMENPKVEIFSMETGMVRFTAIATPVEDDSLNEDIYNELGKTYEDDSVVIELTDLKGTLVDQMGEEVTF